MAHLGNNLFRLQQTLPAELEHGGKGMLDQGSSRGGFEIGVLFFRQCMRGMIRGQGVDTSLAAVSVRSGASGNWCAKVRSSVRASAM